MALEQIRAAADNSARAQPTAWTAEDLSNLASGAQRAIPLIAAHDVVRLSPDMDIWDSWPIQNLDGTIADFDGRQLWMALSAPYDEDMGLRHHRARIRLLETDGRRWRDRGDLLPDGFSPGSREWAGSAIYDAAARAVTLFYTAAGRRGEAKPTFEQRIFQTTGVFRLEGEDALIGDWSAPIECFVADARRYVRVDQSEGRPGEIKAFRDPAYFRDPQDGAEYLFFTGSLGGSTSAFNGAVGAARADDESRTRWTLLPPVVAADHLNNELERPHIIARDGLYYLFWSTQRHVFAPDGPTGPNGLYGMVADHPLGPYRPLNGSGLVAGNPEAEPYQAYSWLVLDTLEVVSFIDFWGLEGRSTATDPALARRQFGGTFAPIFSLRLDGDRATIAPPDET